jgi:dolichol kinase
VKSETKKAVLIKLQATGGTSRCLLLLKQNLRINIIIIIIIIIWLYSPSQALASPLGFRNNNLSTGLDC